MFNDYNANYFMTEYIDKKEGDMMITEIRGFPGYFIADTGDVFCNLGKGNRKRKQTNHFYPLKPRPGANGYVRVCMRDPESGKRVERYVHRLVAETYIPNPENKPHVNHKNCRRASNRTSNLEWATAKENTDYTAEVGHVIRDEKGRYKSNFQYKKDSDSHD